MDLRNAIKQSCDTYFYEASRKLGVDRLNKTGLKFGLGEKVLGKTFIDEKKGLVPSTQWKKDNLGFGWVLGETLITGIGQGYIQTTPLQLCLMTAQLANGGYKIYPRIRVEKDQDTAEQIKNKMLQEAIKKEEENLKNFINNNNLKGLVRLVNFTNNPYNLINSSDIFILSSLYEGLPNVLLESQVLKKFIISTNCPTGPKEILMNGKAGFLFKPKDYKNLAKLIIYAYKNKSKLKKMSNLGYKNLFRFDYSTNIKKYYSTINSIL